MSDVSLRALTASDSQAVWNMELRCFTDPWSADAVRETLSDENVSAIGAYDESGNLIGFGMVYVAADEADLADIAVSPARRRSGIGRALLKGLVSIASQRGAAAAYLEVRQSNTAAISLYTSAGFEALGVRKNYYRSPTEDAVVMRADLSGQI